MFYMLNSFIIIIINCSPSNSSSSSIFFSFQGLGCEFNVRDSLWSWLVKLFVVLQIYACEESNQHSGALVFVLGQLLSSIPFLFLISISSSLVFYFLIGLRDEFSLLMYFVLNFFMSLLVNEGIMLVIATLWQDVFWSVLTLLCIHVSSIFH